MFCSKCGSQANSDAKFCENCGTPFAESAAPPPVEGVASDIPTAPQPPQYPPQPPVVPTEQQQYQQPPQYPPQQPQYPPQQPPPQPQYPPQYPPQYNPPKKKNNAVIIAVASVLAVALIVGGLFLFNSMRSDRDIDPNTPLTPTIGIAETPAPIQTLPPTETPAPSQTGAEIVGRWNQGSGRAIYYFEESAEIEFFALNSDGIGLVYDDYGEWGDWYIISDGIIVIEGESYLEHYGIVELRYEVSGNLLQLTDTDGDIRSYRRVD